ncbi:MAG: 3-deoxy-7-phosphoheptulonate synthase [Chloroflexi bacterium]|nr:3-deoxy-7-phosphoheptulonate synthase [Chloroflexota bacterium]
MIIMKADATEEEVANVIKEVYKFGLRADVSRGEFRTVIGLVGDERKIPFSHFAVLPGVKEAMMVETPYKLVNREYNKLLDAECDCRPVKVGNVTIGGGDPVFIAGPCAVESKEQLLRIAEGVKKAGADILRGGVFKPRSSVHSFQGLGANGKEGAEEALFWLRDVGRKFEMPVITEVRGESQVDLIAEYVDVLQVGARNMYNQDLLAAVARTGKPVMLKRHFGAGVEEFLSFAEYIAAEGNKNIILCERGIVPVGKGKSYTRYTFDLAAIPVVRKETYLPIFADPSHATGRRDLIYSMSCAAISAGASGLMIEAHYNPAESLVDSQQMVTPDELKEIIDACRKIHQVVSLASRVKH